MDAQVNEKLMGVSVATVTTVLFKRGLRNQTIQDVRPIKPKGHNMVGPAFTLRTIPAREDLNGIEVFKNPEHPQRKAIEICPTGSVMVIDSRKDARAASAGDILVTRLQMRGVAGIVTDGGFRDSYSIGELDMPAYQNRPASPTNLTVHQPIEFETPIACGDVAVFPGDIMLGDAESVVVIPKDIAAEVADEAFEMTVYEDFVIERVRAGAPTVGLYPPTDLKNLDDFAVWRKERGR